MWFSGIVISRIYKGNEDSLEKSEVKTHRSIEGKETTFGSSFREIRENDILGDPRGS